MASAANFTQEIAAFKSFTARSLIDALKQRKAERWLMQFKVG
jgi:hypothetical protein